MGFPELPQDLQGFAGQRDIAVLGALAVVNMEEHAGTIHMHHPEVDAFLQPQTAGIDGGKAGTIAVQADQIENPAHLFDAEDDRQLLFPLGADELDRGPVAPAGSL